MTAALALALLGGCATPGREARRLADSGQHEAALELLVQVHADQSSDISLRAAYLKEREATIAQLLAQAEIARRAGRSDEPLTIAERLESIAPHDRRVAWLREDIARSQRHRRLMAEAQTAFDQQQWSRAETVARGVLAEDAGNTSARALLTRVSERLAAQSRDKPTLAEAARKTVSLEFRDASLRGVFEALAHAGGVNFVFDKDVRADSKVSLVLRGVRVDEAMRIVLATQQLDRKLLNDNTVLIYPANAQKQREYQETITRSFYLVSAGAKQAQDLVRTMTKTRDLHVDERLNLLVVRDTPDAMAVVERLIQSIDLPEAEVMMEVEVMEVSSNLLRELGLSWPTTVSYGLVPQSTAAPGNGGYITRDLRSSLRAYVSNPLVAARLNGTSDSTDLLASPRIRARNHEKARVQLGNKLPVFTTTTTGAGSVAGFIASSVSYLDVGLKLDIEPSILLDNDIVLKVALEVSSVVNQVPGPDGSIAYNVGTRQTTTSIRLHDGETEILAGLIQDDERKTAAGVPGLSEVPLLGLLFGVRSNSHDKREIVMLITPQCQPAAAGGRADPFGHRCPAGRVGAATGRQRAGAGRARREPGGTQGRTRAGRAGP
jgi:general secretion pathway protein D